MDTEERKNILVITLSNIGDVVLTTPVICSLRALFPGAKFTVVVGPKAAPLLQGSRLIDRVLIYNKWSGLGHKLKLVRELREEFYDWVVDLKNTGIPYLVRASRRSPFLRRYRAKPARERHLEVLRMMKLPVLNSISFDFFSESDEQSLAAKLKRKEFGLLAPWGVVAPGAGSEAKRWPVEGFREVVDRLIHTTPVSLAVVGDAGESRLGVPLAQVDPMRVVNLAGELTLRELGALVGRARIVLTNDSAVMHLGYELHRPVVALFGPTDPEKYGRENKIWRIVREAPPARFEDLRPEKVFSACETLLRT